MCGPSAGQFAVEGDVDDVDEGTPEAEEDPGPAAASMATNGPLLFPSILLSAAVRLC